MIADLANTFRQVLQMTNEGGATAPTGTYESRPIEIRQKMLAWSGKIESGQSVASAFRVFRASVFSWASAEGLMDVLKGESTAVGLPDVDLSRLRSNFWKERVDKSLKLWSQLIAKITAQPAQEMIFAAGSPPEAWRVSESHYAVKSEHEREIVEDEWNKLRHTEGKNIMSFYGRAKAIRMKLESYGDKRPNASMCKHIARRLLPSFKVCSDHVLLLPDLSSRTMKDLLRRAAHELERNGRSGEEIEEIRHALTAAGVGRGDRGWRNAGDRGYGERDRTYTYCAHHGEGQGHNTPECIVMRRNSTDTTVISTNTCRRGDSGRTQDAEEGAGRKVNIDSNRTQTTRVPVGVGATPRSSRESRRQDTDPGLASMQTPFPEDVATTGIILRAGAAEAGARASGRCHRLFFRRIRRRIFCLICRLDDFPMDRGTLSPQIIPTRTNTWDTQRGGHQRGTGHHHHRRRSWGLPSSSSSSSTKTTKNSKRARLLPRLPLLLQLSLFRLPAQLKPA